MIRIGLAYVILVILVPLLLALGVLSMWGRALHRLGVALQDGTEAAVRRIADGLNRLAGFSG